LSVPPGWTATTLGSLGHYWNGRGFKTSEWRTIGRRIIRIQDLTGTGRERNYYDGPVDPRNVVREGDLLVSWAASLGVYVWPGPEAVLNQHIFKVESFIDRTFHRYLLEYVLADLRRQTHGSGIVHITRDRFEQIPVHVPEIDDQRRIAAAIDEQLSRVETALASLAAANSKLDQLDDRLAADAFDRQWPMAHLGEVADVVGGVTKDAQRESGEGLIEIPYLRVANVQRGHLDLAKVSRIRVKPGVASSLRLERGDVLMTEGGDRDKLGRGWIWDGQIDWCIYQNHIFRARTRAEQLLPKFLSWYANTHGREWFAKQGKQTTNLASISISKLRAFPVPTPPLTDQIRAVAQIEAAASVNSSVRQTIRRASSRGNSLRHAVLRAAFTGRLGTVPINDENAFVIPAGSWLPAHV
jgi:type I restriction enzyme, S subunit